MKRKLLVVGLYVIITATFLEIVFYFIYIFKPFDRLAGRDIGVPKGIPTVSELLTPSLLSQYIMRADESKTFYSQRLEDFTKDLNSVMPANSSFVKTAEANYVVAGNVVEIKPQEKDYDIILSGSAERKYVEHISSSEAQYAQVFLEDVSSNNYSKIKKAFSDIKVGDYLTIKRSTNLLNPAEKNVEIEILQRS